MKPLRWSPVVGAEDWGVALKTAAEMVATLNTADMRGGEHWKDRAADLLAAVMHWAALQRAHHEGRPGRGVRLLHAPPGRRPSAARSRPG